MKAKDSPKKVMTTEEQAISDWKTYPALRVRYVSVVDYFGVLTMIEQRKGKESRKGGAL